MTEELTLEELEDNMHKATIAYLLGLKKIQEPIFMDYIKEKVINNNDAMYKYYFPNDKKINKETNNDETNFANTSVTIEPYKKMCKEILLRVRPGGNKGFEEKANEAFIKFSSYSSDKRIDTIKYLHNFINGEKFLDVMINYNNEGSYKEIIVKLTCEQWYLFSTDINFRNLFIKKEEYEKIQILKKELDETRERNIQLYDELNKFRMSKP
jgi:hypothetical protein